MELNQETIARTLKLATSEHWENGLPVVRAQIRLVVNSLKSQWNSKVLEEPDEFLALLRQKRNKGIRKILKDNQVTPEMFAFAIRDTLK